MKAPVTAIVLGFALLAPVHCPAQSNATLVVSQTTLNRLVGKLGVLSNSGIHQAYRMVQTPVLFEMCEAFGFLECPGLGKDPAGFSRDRIPLVMCRTVGGEIHIMPAGEPVSWQWWVTGARFTLQSNAMTFTATVRSRIGGNETTTTRTVPASVVFDPPTNRVVAKINAFAVPLQYTVAGATPTVTTVDVAKLFSIAIPVEPQTIVLPPIQGSTTRTLVGKVANLQSVTYRPNEVEVGFNLLFTRQ
jgi:hypothetical protein